MVYNHRKNTFRIYHISAQFPFTASKRETDFYHQKVNVQVSSYVAEGLTTWGLIKLGNFKEILEMLAIDGQVLFDHPKENH